MQLFIQIPQLTLEIQYIFFSFLIDDRKPPVNTSFLLLHRNASKEDCTIRTRDPSWRSALLYLLSKVYLQQKASPLERISTYQRNVPESFAPSALDRKQSHRSTIIRISSRVLQIRIIVIFSSESHAIPNRYNSRIQNWQQYNSMPLYPLTPEVKSVLTKVSLDLGLSTLRLRCTPVSANI